MSDRRPELTFTGQAASPGLTIGHVFVHARSAVGARPPGTPAEETQHLAAALESASARLARLAAGADEVAQGILEFQIALVEDGELIGPVQKAILRGVPAAEAWREVLDGQVAEYEASDDDNFRARASDLADLRDRVLDLLLGATEAEPISESGAT